MLMTMGGAYIDCSVVLIELLKQYSAVSSMLLMLPSGPMDYLGRILSGEALHCDNGVVDMRS